MIVRDKRARDRASSQPTTEVLSAQLNEYLWAPDHVRK